MNRITSFINMIKLYVAAFIAINEKYFATLYLEHVKLFRFMLPKETNWVELAYLLLLN